MEKLTFKYITGVGPMRMGVKRGLILLFALLSLLSLSGAEELEYEYGIHVVRPDSSYIMDEYPVPEFLSREDLVFVSCVPEDVPVRTSLLCQGTNTFEDVPNYKWGEGNCYVAGFNLDGLACEDMQIQAQYSVGEEKKRYVKDVTVHKYSELLDSILDTQYSDGGWKGSRNTAYGVWGLSHFPTAFDHEVEEAIDWLKVERDEEKKCWPGSPCHVPQTMEMLYLLQRSGFDDGRRTMHDAKNWIESKQSFYEPGDTWTLEVESLYPKTYFLIASVNDRVFDRNFTLDEGKTKRYQFETRLNTTVYAASYLNFEARVRDKYGDLMMRYQGNNLTYPLPGSCWSQGRRGAECDPLTTAYASMLDLEDRRKREAKRWMFTDVRNAKPVGLYYATEEEILPTATYISVLYNDTLENYISDYGPYMGRFQHLNEQERFERYREELIDWLLYEQNNDGSWGDLNHTVTERALPTAFSVLALKHAGYNRTYEPVEDAEKWISSHESEIARNNTVALASAFSVLQNNARPLVVSKPPVIQVHEKKTTFELYNPTTFDLSDVRYNLTNGLGEYLYVDSKCELSAYSYCKVNIYQNASTKKDRYGYLKPIDFDEPLARIPVIVTDFPNINVTGPDETTVFGRKGTVALSAKKTDHTFSCSIEWESDEVSSGDFTFSGNSQDVTMRFSEAETKDAMYSGVVTCTARGEEFTSDISVFVERYADEPFSMSPRSVTVNGTKDGVFEIKNNLDQEVSVKLQVGGRGATSFSVPSQVSLYPGEVRNVTIENGISAGRNTTLTFPVQGAAMGVEKSVSVTLLVDNLSPAGGGIMGYIFLGLSVLLVIGAGVTGYIYREKLKTLLSKFDTFKIQKELETNVKQLHELRKTEKVNSITNMVNILKVQNLSDDKVKEKLKEYFSEEELRMAAEEGVSIPGVESEAEE